MAPSYSQIIDLGAFPGGRESWPWAISNTEWITGFSMNASGTSRAFRTSVTSGAGGMLDLGTLGGTESTGWGVNDLGAIVGQAQTVGASREASSWLPRQR